MSARSRHPLRLKGAYRHLLIGLVILIIAATAMLVPRSRARADVGEVQIAVNGDFVTQSGNAGGYEAIGINTPVYNAHFLDPGISTVFDNNQISPVNHSTGGQLVTASLSHGTGTTLFRYPGGGTTDVYHWKTNRVGPINPATPQQKLLSYADPAMNFDAFMRQVGAMATSQRTSADIVVNYGSSTPQDAADWVRYANKGGPGYTGPVPTYGGASSTGHNYGIQFWEIGNENYGDGTYGNQFEYTDKITGPSMYASQVVLYSRAMKAVDPTIKIGAVLTMPGNYPDGQSPDWDGTVLQTACSSIDFVSVHWYPQQPLNPGPGGESDAGLLASPQNGTVTSPSIPSMAQTLRNRINQFCGAHASAVKIQVTEVNSVAYNPGKQTTGPINALFLADAFQVWSEQAQYGVTAVYLWDMFNSPSQEDYFNPTNLANNDPNLDSGTDYGSFGLFSGGTGDCDPANAAFCTPIPLDTPYPSFYGMQMVHFLRGSGAQGLDASFVNDTYTPMISVHAMGRADGTEAVMLINKDPSNAYLVEVDINLNPARDSLSSMLPGPVDIDTYDPNYDENSITIQQSAPYATDSQIIIYMVWVQPYTITVINPQELYFG